MLSAPLSAPKECLLLTAMYLERLCSWIMVRCGHMQATSEQGGSNGHSPQCMESDLHATCQEEAYLPAFCITACDPPGRSPWWRQHSVSRAGQLDGTCLQQEITEEQDGRKKPGRRGRPPKARDLGMSAQDCQADEIGAEERTALSLSHWEECMQCNTWVELGSECEEKACPSCGEQV